MDVAQVASGRDGRMREHASVGAWRGLRSLVTAIGIGWALAFVVVGLVFQLQYYGDGSFFSYAIAVEEAWAYHWHNISGRVVVYLVSHAPAEAYVHMTGDVRGGLVVYGFLHFVAQVVGLAATWRADGSRDRIIFTFACLSTACLCPLVFGFPTEMWMSHAVFWPTLAAVHYARPDVRGWATVFGLMLALVLTHEGAVVYAASIVVTAAALDFRAPRSARAAATFGAAMVVWAIVKWTLQPDPYLSEVLGRNAINFINVGHLASGIGVLLVATLAVYGFALRLLRSLSPARATLGAAAIATAVLVVHWLLFDDMLHAEGRYTMRTALLLATPALGVLAIGSILIAEPGRTRPQWRVLQQALDTVAGLTRRLRPEAIGVALVLVTFVNVVETAKFVGAWDAYKAAVRRLTTTDPAAAAPNVGGAFVSSGQLNDRLNRLAWFSTTQYLSVLVDQHFSPTKLVVDDDARYFWIACETALATENAEKAIPRNARALVRQFSCLHRRDNTPAKPPLH